LKGGQSQRREVRGAGGANGVEFPTEEGVWGGGCAPSPEIKKNFFGSMCSKNFCVQAKGGGGHRPVAPLNTPLIRCALRRAMTCCRLLSASRCCTWLCASVTSRRSSWYSSRRPSTSSAATPSRRHGCVRLPSVTCSQHMN